MDRAILTIITSTYNRKELLKANIEKMLECDDSRLRFIISDNASVDDTWNMLNTIKDERVKIYRNEVNLDITNATLTSKYAQSCFFMFVNDRDYIEPDDIVKLIDFLEENNDLDILASVKGSRFIKEGIVNGTRFCDFYNLANHPGNLVFNTDFYKNIIDYDLIYKWALDKNTEAVNAYATFQLLLNIDKAYYRPFSIINQPKNRDKVLKQARKELYGAAYVLAEYHMGIYDSLINYADNYSGNGKIADVLLSTYRTSLDKTEFEYYFSVLSDAFRERNNCQNARPKQWLKNGYNYMRYVSAHEKTGKYLKKSKIFMSFIRETFISFIRICRIGAYGEI